MQGSSLYKTVIIHQSNKKRVRYLSAMLIIEKNLNETKKKYYFSLPDYIRYSLYTYITRALCKTRRYMRYFQS